MQKLTPEQKAEIASDERQGLIVALVLSFALVASAAFISYLDDNKDAAPPRSVQSQQTSTLSAAPLLR